MNVRLRRRRAAALVAALALASGAHAATVETVRTRGVLNCGVSGAAPGFSSLDAKGQWRGLDVDVCRAVAAAVLGDARAVRFVPTTSQNRFAALQSGEVDLLSRMTSWNLSRDTLLGLQFAAIDYYDGQGLMVPVRLRVSRRDQLEGAHVCVTSGSTSERNLAAYFAAAGLRFTPVVYDTAAAAIKAYAAGRCQAMTSDLSDLAGIRMQLARPAEHLILKEAFSKEPLGPMVRRGDDEWLAIVRWTVFALVGAEELGVAQTSQGGADSAVAMLGRLRLPGLRDGWALRAVRAVGNYGEVFERNLGRRSGIGVERGMNALWNQGGLMYAPPFD